MKRCPKCGEEKPLDAFGRKATAPDGHQWDCRECLRAHERERYATDPVRFRRKSANWRTRNPEAAREVEQRHRRSGKRRAYETRWRKAHARQVRDKSLAWYYRNPDQARTYMGARRARIRGSKAEPISVARIVQRDGLRCHICGKAVRREEVSLDHLVPIVHGGVHAEWNLAVAHLFCNKSRGAGRIPAQLRLPFS